MFDIETKQTQALERDLFRFARQSMAFATRETVNQAAFRTRQGYLANIRNDLTLRNKWTERSVQVDRAKTLRISRQEARVGSVADYMDEQEFGGTVRGSGKSQPIATNYAAGQSRGVRPRTRTPIKSRRRANIKIRQDGPSTLLAKVHAAIRSGERYFYHDFGRRAGIFRVVGGSRRTKRGWPAGAKLELVWDLTQRSVVVPRRPMLGPATVQTTTQLDQIYRAALLQQLRRARLFGY